MTIVISSFRVDWLDGILVFVWLDSRIRVTPTELWSVESVVRIKSVSRLQVLFVHIQIFCRPSAASSAVQQCKNIAKNSGWHWQVAWHDGVLEGCVGRAGQRRNFHQHFMFFLLCVVLCYQPIAWSLLVCAPLQFWNVWRHSAACCSRAESFKPVINDSLAFLRYQGLVPLLLFRQRFLERYSTFIIGWNH